MKKFDFDDILIEPAPVSEIYSRTQCDPHDETGMLPIFAAPMIDVVTMHSARYFYNNKIIPILARSTFKLSDFEGITDKNWWVALSLKEFEDWYVLRSIENTPLDKTLYILIDIANGHMKQLVDIVKCAKEKFGDKVQLMVGNVANPWTYKNLSDAGADYIRIGIGNGGVCLTTEQTGIGYPMASLIQDCYQLKCEYNLNTKIVADGGMKKYSDIIKALALGADYVMLGSILNKALESAGDTYRENIKHETWTEPGDQVDQHSESVEKMFKNGTRYFKKIRGMSTKEVQEIIGNGKKIKTSEGIIKMQQVGYTVQQWKENMEDYLRSAMSYTNSENLEEFIGKVHFNYITENSLNRFKK